MEKSLLASNEAPSSTFKSGKEYFESNLLAEASAQINSPEKGLSAPIASLVSELPKLTLSSNYSGAESLSKNAEAAHVSEQGKLAVGKPELPSEGLIPRPTEPNVLASNPGLKLDNAVDAVVFTTLAGRIIFEQGKLTSMDRRFGIPGLVGGAAAFSLYRDTNSFLASKSLGESIYYGTAILCDVSALTGSAMVAAGMRRHGEMPMALGLTGRAALAGGTRMVKNVSDYFSQN